MVKKRKLKELKTNLLLSFFVIITMLVLLETSLRIYYNSNYNYDKFEKIVDESIITNLARINLYNSVTHYKYTSRINSDGFRDAEYSIKKPNNTIRIAVIGDSYTFGHGLENLYSAYPKVLENYLNKNQKEINYQVLNFGFPGANVLDLYWILKYKVIKYNPDIIMYAYYPNDLEFFNHNINMNFCHLFNENFKNFLFLDFIDIRLDNFLKYFRKPKDNPFYYAQLTEDNYYGWNCFKDLVKEFERLSEQNNFKFVTFVIPSRLYPNEEEKLIKKRVYHQFTKNNLIVIQNFLDSFWEKTKNKTESELRVSVEDNEMHYNEQGHKIIAEILYPYLLKSKLVENITIKK
jgi:lysophospholipase L1-like esterase